MIFGRRSFPFGAQYELFNFQQVLVSNITHTIHETGIFTYIYHKDQPYVGKYIPVSWMFWEINLLVEFQTSQSIACFTVVWLFFLTPCQFRISLDDLFHVSGLGFRIDMTPVVKFPSLPIACFTEASPAGVVSYVQMDETGPTKGLREEEMWRNSIKRLRIIFAKVWVKKSWGSWYSYL